MRICDNDDAGSRVIRRGQIYIPSARLANDQCSISDERREEYMTTEERGRRTPSDRPSAPIIASIRTSKSEACTDVSGDHAQNLRTKAMQKANLSPVVEDKGQKGTI
jgi:hypothetical protein